jgi:hypothetical protein
MEPNINVDTDAHESAIKQRVGKIGRSLKQIDLRKQIVAHPLAAVGIATAAGAILGLVRPKPQAGRLSSLLFATAGAVGFRLVREAAMTELGTYARNFLLDRRDNQADDVSESFGAAQQSQGSGVRYTPTL